MITLDNLKDVLKLKEFKEREGKYVKEYKDLPGVYMQVDFQKEKLIYPVEKGLKINGEYTTNFSEKENFVVFECVDRLLHKGYRPEHIELEPKWQVGHGSSGGRADIMVKDNTGRSFLIIECKTPGSEFKKEWENTLNGRGQLFSYARQTGTTQYICLYTSYLKENEVGYDSYIIALQDNEKYLKELGDDKALTFKNAKLLEAEDLYEAWRKTYNCAYATIGIFEDEIDAYTIGKLKYTVKDLKEISDRDIQTKYHQFATILRQHNISGHENAFDKLVNLFLCKVVDESKNKDDLKFYWKSIVYDNYFDLQDRLQKLYQSGMKEFLGEEVTYIDNSQIDAAFRFFSSDPDATKETIKKYFRQLKFFTNNDFAFIEVHNEKLFYQNAIVLLKMVEMLQGIRLQTNNDNQFLGDLFEGFLDKGVKQSEGQYFTPMPIVKFILYSLPLEKIYKEAELPPQVIDYACGAGHFLTELAKQIKLILANENVDLSSYYKAITGIEKEYRLSKVSKVSAFMYRQDDIKIIYADALSRKSGVKNGEYSVLVANPPYSVKGFLETLDKKEREAFELSAVIDDKTLAINNCIETFFIERAKQLLRPGGVAGIILPSSILSNDKAIYMATREILIKYFYIKAIVEFGSQTFGKTGTNTVVLFLQRREENPAAADHWKNRVNDWFYHRDEAKEKTYADLSNLQGYCDYIGIPYEDYRTFVEGNPSSELLSSEIFIQYRDEFDRSTEVKNIKSKKSFKEKTPEEQNKLLFNRFIQNVFEIEKDKIYYYLLASGQQVLIVKSPSGNAEQKKFLGYEWSNAKGNEGIKYLSSVFGGSEEDANELLEKLSGLQNIRTPLYDPQDRHNHKKINSLIAQHFEGEDFDIPDELSAYVSYSNLVDLLDFTRKNFNKVINLAPQKGREQIRSRWPLVKLEDVAEIKKGTALTKKDTQQGNVKVVAGGIDFAYYHNVYNRLENTITISASGANAGFVNYWKEKIYASDCTTLRGNAYLSSLYIYIVLKYWFQDHLFSLARGAAQPHVYPEDIKKILIPNVSTDIQQKLINEYEEVEKQVEEAQISINHYVNEIENIIKRTGRNSKEFIALYQLAQLNPSKKELLKIDDHTLVSFVEMASVSNNGYIISKIDKPLIELKKGSYTYFREGDIIIAKITPCMENGKCAVAENLTNGIGLGSSEFHVIRPNVTLNAKFLFAFLNRESVRQEAAKNMTGASGHRRVPISFYEKLQIPVLSLKEQEEIVREIELLKEKIKNSEQIITEAPGQKRAILQKYL